MKLRYSVMFIKIWSKVLAIILFASNRSSCSRVIDELGQRSVYVSEYCPDMPYCKEGSHVMCMFYDKENERGPRCINAQNVTITPLLATKLLEIANAIRSKIALGKEKGKGGAPLPRAYGMLRLQWDEELATFAQVLANQCVLRHDLCRATKSFPDPGQTAGLVRYTYPEWNSMSGTVIEDDNNTPGLNQAKLIYAVKQSAKSWYVQKSSVTPEMIIKYPDWQQHPTRQAGKLYLEMIAGHSTHMGCGISAYSEYTYRNNFAAMNYNSVQIICNFSGRPRPGTSVYNTEPPVNPPPGTRCGCPVGYDEDEDCLCNENPYYTPTPKPKSQSCKGKNCVPPIVLLPIVAMEDAPPHKLIERRYNNETHDQIDHLEILNADNAVKNLSLHEAYSHNDYDKMLREARNNLQHARSLTNNEQQWKLQNRYFAKNPLIPENRHLAQSVHKSLDHVRPSAKQNLRKSIFSKVEKFELPLKVQIKKDVVPRKDFSNVQKLVKTYLNSKRNMENVLSEGDLKSRIGIQSLHLNEVTTAVYTGDIEKRYSNFEQLLKKQFYDKNFITSNNSLSNLYGKTSNEDSDKKLLYLLDNLEQEVNHINLDQTEKDILDQKLRKIYGRISNNPKGFLSSKKHRDNDFKSIFTDAERNDFLKFENTVNEHLLDERRRKAFIDDLKRDGSNGHTKNDEDNFNIRKQLLEKDRNNEDNLRTLRKRLEKPINDNEYSNNPDLKYDDRLNAKSRNALIEYDHDRSNKIRDLVNDANYDEDLTERNLRKNKIRNDKHSYKNYENLREKNYYLNNLDKENQLSYNRRKYYQDKIDYLEQKLQKVRNHQRHNKLVADRQLRPVQPNRKELPVRPSPTKSKKNDFYMPDRARSVHGF